MLLIPCEALIKKIIDGEPGFSDMDHHSLDVVLQRHNRTNMVEHPCSEISEHRLPLTEVVEAAKRPCDSGDRKAQLQNYDKRYSLACLVCTLAALVFAFMAGQFVPRVIFSLPTAPLLILLWTLVSPSSGFVGAVLLCATMGVAYEGYARGLAMSVCSTAGLSAILVALNQAGSQRKFVCSRAWEMISAVLRWPCECAMQVIWVLPLMLTLPFRLPVALFLDSMAAAMFAVGEAVLYVSEAFLGCGIADSLESEGLSSTRTPVIFVNGLNSTRAIWLVGLLFLRARAKHLGPFVILRYRARGEDGLENLACVLQDKIVEESRRLTASRVILVGHSVGGVLCAMIADNLQEAGEGVTVDSVVCISAPWRQRNTSSVTNSSKSPTCSLFGLPESLIMMVLGGNIGSRMRSDLGEGGLVEEIGEKLLQRGKWEGRIFNLGGQIDPLITRAGSLLWVTAFRTCIVPHVAHLSAPLSQTVWGQVLLWIDQDRPTGNKTSKLMRPTFMGMESNSNIAADLDAHNMA